jgi:organic radical activating enzyme
VRPGGIAYRPKDELHPTPGGQVLERLLAYEVPLIVISGGEPLSQQRRLGRLVDGLLAAGRKVEFETNGTVAPSAALRVPGVRFNVSPKLRHAGDDTERRIVPEALKVLRETDDVAFKFVCRDERDLDEVAGLVEEHDLAPVWIMPEGTERETLLKSQSAIADAVIARGWNLTSRMHVLIWGNKRGI